MVNEKSQTQKSTNGRFNPVQFNCSVMSDCVTDCSAPCLPVHSQFLEFTQTMSIGWLQQYSWTCKSNVWHNKSGWWLHLERREPIGIARGQKEGFWDVGNVLLCDYLQVVCLWSAHAFPYTLFIILNYQTVTVIFLITLFITVSKQSLHSQYYILMKLQEMHFSNI